MRFLRKELLTLVRFSAVGALATLLHFVVALLLLWNLSITLQLANMMAFLCALAFSFLGHRHFTFRSQRAVLTSGTRFVVTAVTAYLCSAGVLTMLEGWTTLPAEMQLLLAATVIPVTTYAAGRLWVF